MLSSIRDTLLSNIKEKGEEENCAKLSTIQLKVYTSKCPSNTKTHVFTMLFNF